MRSRRYRKLKEAPELDITAFLNLMVVLVPFLLISAVFSRVTIMELNMPTGAGGGAADDPSVTVEVVVREQSLEIGDGEKVIARFLNLNQPLDATQENPEKAAESLQGEENEIEVANLEEPVLATKEVYDLAKLRDFLLRIKQSYPDKTDAILLMEEQVAYEHLVGIMDAVRAAEIVKKGSEGTDPQIEKVILFPDISIGDAP